MLACGDDFVFAAAAGGDHDHDDDRHDDRRDDPQLGQPRAPCRAGRLGLLQRFALRARLLAPLLAREVSLVVPTPELMPTFYTFSLKLV